MLLHLETAPINSFHFFAWAINLPVPTSVQPMALCEPLIDETAVEIQTEPTVLQKTAASKVPSGNSEQLSVAKH